MSDAFLIGSILDTTAGYICVLDSSGKILAVNDGFARLINGRGRESLTGNSAHDSVRGSVELKDLFSTLSTRNNGSFMQAVHRNAEKPVWIQFSKTTLNAPDNENCILLIGNDVTGLMMEKSELETKIQDRTNFLIRMGHELKTPLNTVLGYAQLLSGLEQLPDEGREYAATILTQENNLLHLLNDVLEYSKYEAGQTETILSKTNVHKLVEDVTRSYLDDFTRKMLSLTVEYKNDIPEAILSDPGKIAQVLSNLLGNALKYTKKGGVTITISCDKKITIDIEDTGIGIPDDEKETIFDIFTQTGVGPGHTGNVGIGLAVARIFARMLGGDVTLVRSGNGNGSVFRFSFDAKPLESTGSKTQQIVDYSTIKGLSRPCKILLVDDVDINLAMLEIFLAPAGFDISIASNGREAVRQFRDFKPDIVFMDLIMPDMDGFEATREIKALDPDTPVIALTASIVDNVKAQALESGVNDFMYKPFIPERFFEIISEYTGIVYTVG